MAVWRPQPYRRDARAKSTEESILDAAVAVGESVVAVDPSLPPIFTLRHLAHLTGTKYGLLRMMVSRRIDEPYRVFKIGKRPSRTGEKRFRIICAPDPSLLKVQRWVAQNVLARGRTHSASTAYAPGCKLVDAAATHCRSKWLIKLDIKNFFESISEISAYRAYISLGYQPLVAFELARLSTRLGSLTSFRRRNRWRRHYYHRDNAIKNYVRWQMGHLPQGAPTSPMLANMAMLPADQELSAVASRYGLTYTRYADDLTFSTADAAFCRDRAAAVVREVYACISRFGLSPNFTKTQIVPPRARKVVLGLLVDTDKPRLPRTFRANLRMHLHYLEHEQFGPAKHAKNRGFSAVVGLRNHLEGLISYARQIDPKYGDAMAERLRRVTWPI